MDLLVVGSVGLDDVETPKGKQESVLGGAASHASAAASLFTPPRLVGVVGDDFPANYREALSSRSIDLDGLQTVEGKTFRWGGRYAGDCAVAETLFTHLNVFEHFRPTLPEKYKASEFVFLANIDPELQLQVREQLDQPTLVAADTMNFWIHGDKRPHLDRLLERIDLLFVNDEEARDLTGEGNLVRAGRKLLEKGLRAVVIKEGAHGAVLVEKDRLFHAPAFPEAKLVDPTGAGDSFAGGFMGFLAREGDVSSDALRRAVVYGCVIGSYNIEDFGPQALFELQVAQVEARFEQMLAFTQLQA